MKMGYTNTHYPFLVHRSKNILYGSSKFGIHLQVFYYQLMHTVLSNFSYSRGHTGGDTNKFPLLEYPDIIQAQLEVEEHFNKTFCFTQPTQPWILPPAHTMFSKPCWKVCTLCLFYFYSGFTEVILFLVIDHHWMRMRYTEFTVTGEDLCMARFYCSVQCILSMYTYSSQHKMRLGKTLVHDIQDGELQKMKTSLNGIKKSLGEQEVSAWQLHTSNTNPAQKICSTVRSRTQAEMVTQVLQFYPLTT